METIQIIMKKWKSGTLKDIWEEWLWIYQYVKKYSRSIVLFIVLGLCSTLMGLAGSVVSKYLIDIVTGFQKSDLWIMVSLLVGTTLATMAFSALNSRISMVINVKIQNDIQADIFDKIVNVNWLDISRYHSGDILNRFSSDVNTVAGSVVGWFPTLITGIFSFIGAFALIFYYDPTMSVIALINAPIMLLASKFITRRMRGFNRDVKEMNSEMLAFEGETFQNIDSIKSFDLVSRFSEKLRTKQEKYKKTMLQYNAFSIKTNALLSILGFVVQYSCFGWALYRLWSGQITYGTMTLFITQAANLSGSFSSLVGIVPSTISSTISARRIMDIVEQPQEVREDKDIAEVEMERKQGFSVSLKQVFFSYIPEYPVLTESTMEAKPNEIVALVGPSGEGKTTLIRMFLGLIYPESGQAVLGTASGRERALGPVTRRFFAYVPQGNSIFSGSVADNLRMVCLEATDEEVINALKTACAWKFVKDLPEGIDSEIGERGHGLSEGQAQRISIARAVICDAPILLLDEATSALDVQTEREVLRNIIQRHPNKTCIVTTHRPSVLSMCQRVYRVMDTKVTEISAEESAKMSIDF